MEQKKQAQLKECPYCGCQLDKGILYTYGGPGLLFLRRLPKMHMFMSGNRMSKEEGSIVLDGIYQTRVNHTAIIAYACRNCKAVICFYS